MNVTFNLSHANHSADSEKTITLCRSLMMSQKQILNEAFYKKFIFAIQSKPDDRLSYSLAEKIFEVLAENKWPKWSLEFKEKILNSSNFQKKIAEQFFSVCLNENEHNFLSYLSSIHLKINLEFLRDGKGQNPLHYALKNKELGDESFIALLAKLPSLLSEHDHYGNHPFDTLELPKTEEEIVKFMGRIYVCCLQKPSKEITSPESVEIILKHLLNITNIDNLKFILNNSFFINKLSLQQFKDIIGSDLENLETKIEIIRHYSSQYPIPFIYLANSISTKLYPIALKSEIENCSYSPHIEKNFQRCDLRELINEFHLEAYSENFKSISTFCLYSLTFTQYPDLFPELIYKHNGLISNLKDRFIIILNNLLFFFNNNPFPNYLFQNYCSTLSCDEKIKFIVLIGQTCDDLIHENQHESAILINLFNHLCVNNIDNGEEFLIIFNNTHLFKFFSYITLCNLLMKYSDVWPQTDDSLFFTATKIYLTTYYTLSLVQQRALESTFSKILPYLSHKKLFLKSYEVDSFISYLCTTCIDYKIFNFLIYNLNATQEFFDNLFRRKKTTGEYLICVAILNNGRLLTNECYVMSEKLILEENIHNHEKVDSVTLSYFFQALACHMSRHHTLKIENLNFIFPRTLNAAGEHYLPFITPLVQLGETFNLYAKCFLMNSYGFFNINKPLIRCLLELTHDREQHLIGLNEFYKKIYIECFQNNDLFSAEDLCFLSYCKINIADPVSQSELWMLFNKGPTEATMTLFDKGSQSLEILKTSKAFKYNSSAGLYFRGIFLYLQSNMKKNKFESSFISKISGQQVEIIMNEKVYTTQIFINSSEIFKGYITFVKLLRIIESETFKYCKTEVISKIQNEKSLLIASVEPSADFLIQSNTMLCCLFGYENFYLYLLEPGELTLTLKDYNYRDIYNNFSIISQNKDYQNKKSLALRMHLKKATLDHCFADLQPHFLKPYLLFNSENGQIQWVHQQNISYKSTEEALKLFNDYQLKELNYSKITQLLAQLDIKAKTFEGINLSNISEIYAELNTLSLKLVIFYETGSFIFEKYLEKIYCLPFEPIHLNTEKEMILSFNSIKEASSVLRKIILIEHKLSLDFLMYSAIKFESFFNFSLSQFSQEIHLKTTHSFFLFENEELFTSELGEFLNDFFQKIYLSLFYKKVMQLIEKNFNSMKILLLQCIEAMIENCLLDFETTNTFQNLVFKRYHELKKIAFQSDSLEETYRELISYQSSQQHENHLKMLIDSRDKAKKISYSLIQEIKKIEYEIAENELALLKNEKNGKRAYEINVQALQTQHIFFNNKRENENKKILSLERQILDLENLKKINDNELKLYHLEKERLQEEEKVINRTYCKQTFLENLAFRLNFLSYNQNNVVITTEGILKIFDPIS